MTTLKRIHTFAVIVVVICVVLLMTHWAFQ